MVTLTDTLQTTLALMVRYLEVRLSEGAYDVTEQLLVRPLATHDTDLVASTVEPGSRLAVMASTAARAAALNNWVVLMASVYHQ
jgi:hypothetical protein